jgi:ribonuclease Y
MVLELIVLAVVVAVAALYLNDRRSARGIARADRDLTARGGAHRGQSQADAGQADGIAAASGTAQQTSPVTAEPAAREADLQREISAAREASAARAALDQAQAEATSIVESASREAAALRRAAQAEADAARRSVQLEAAAAASDAQKVRDDAEQSAKEFADRAAALAARQADAEAERRTAQLRQDEAELAGRQRDAEEMQALIESRSAQLDELERDLREERADLGRRRDELTEATRDLAAQTAELQSQLREAAQQRELDAAARTAELERVASLTAADARGEVLRAAESSARRDAAILARDIEAQARAEADSRARAIVAESVQRVASEQTAETVVSVMHLASDEMKGRIIGREGRNIRSFESVTGVNVIIDDTPEAVLLSCFDPVRREVGRLTLEKLLADGRIHPHRIEEMYERSRDEVEQLCLRAAQDALLELHIDDVDPQLLPVIGRLRYRTSYGQNVLAHSLESAQVAGVMAAELGLVPAVYERSAFLHDIGKALTHEVEGSHAIIGAALLRKHGESEVVAHAVEAHHNEVPAISIEDVLTQAADACSAARPGARRESIEAYVKRLARIEEIASARDGVEKVFAMQAGREVRVMVRPEAIDDLEAGIIAREIAKQIEDELTYPGQIRVTVVRESRSTEIAH